VEEGKESRKLHCETGEIRRWVPRRSAGNFAAPELVGERGRGASCLKNEGATGRRSEDRLGCSSRPRPKKKRGGKNVWSATSEEKRGKTRGKSDAQARKGGSIVRRSRKKKEKKKTPRGLKKGKKIPVARAWMRRSGKGGSALRGQEKEGKKCFNSRPRRGKKEKGLCPTRGKELLARRKRKGGLNRGDRREGKKTPATQFLPTAGLEHRRGEECDARNHRALGG